MSVQNKSLFPPLTLVCRKMHEVHAIDAHTTWSIHVGLKGQLIVKAKRPSSLTKQAESTVNCQFVKNKLSKGLSKTQLWMCIHIFSFIKMTELYRSFWTSGNYWLTDKRNNGLYFLKITPCVGFGNVCLLFVHRWFVKMNRLF